MRSRANELPSLQFHFTPGFFLRTGPGPKKKGLAEMNSIPQHANPGSSQRQRLLNRLRLEKLSRLRLFCDWNLEQRALGARDRLGFLCYRLNFPGDFMAYAVFLCYRLNFPGDFMAYAVFVEFCSKPRSQAITARFLVQISCSWRKENF